MSTTIYFIKDKNNKRKITTSLEDPLKKRKQDSIFNIITTDIWKIIFQFIYESVDCYRYSRGYLWVRLTCKLFRELSLPYWNQEIPEANLESYFVKENSLEFIHKIIINGTLINLKKKEGPKNYWKDFTTACVLGFLPIVKKMVQCGANVNQVHQQNSLLTIVALASYTEFLRFSKKKCNIGKYENLLKVIDFLLENGADVKKSNEINEQ